MSVPDPSADSPPALEVARALLNFLYNSGEVRLGGRLPPERQLAEAFGVGRSAVREALKSLNLLGLVKIRQGDGTYLVSDSLELLPRVMEWGMLLGVSGLDDTLEARVPVVDSVVRLAAQRCDGARAARLNLAWSELEAADSAGFVEAEWGLRQALADTADNGVLSSMMLGLDALLRVWLERTFDDESARSATVAELGTVIQAVVSGDPESAGRAAAAHLEASAQRIAAHR